MTRRLSQSVPKVCGSANETSRWIKTNKNWTKRLKHDVPAMTEGVRTRQQLCGRKKTQRPCRGRFIASDSGQTRSHVTPPRTPTCSLHEPPRPPSSRLASDNNTQNAERSVLFFLTLGVCRRRKTTGEFHTCFSAVLTVQTRTKVKPVAIFTGDRMIEMRVTMRQYGLMYSVIGRHPMEET